MKRLKNFFKLRLSVDNGTMPTLGPLVGPVHIYNWWGIEKPSTESTRGFHCEICLKKDKCAHFLALSSSSSSSNRRSKLKGGKVRCPSSSYWSKWKTSKSGHVLLISSKKLGTSLGGRIQVVLHLWWYFEFFPGISFKGPIVFMQLKHSWKFLIIWIAIEDDFSRI